MKKISLSILFLFSTSILCMKAPESQTDIQVAFASLISIDEMLTKTIKEGFVTLDSFNFAEAHTSIERTTQLLRDFNTQNQYLWNLLEKLNKILQKSILSSPQEIALVQLVSQTADSLKALENRVVTYFDTLDRLHNQFTQKNQKVDCQSCLLEICEGQTQILNCGHLYCQECLKRLIEIAFKEKNVLTTLICKIDACNTPFTQQDIEKALPTKEQLSVLNEIATYQTIASLPNGKHCPSVGCTYAYIDERSNRARSITCPKCTHTYCSNCLKPHAPQVKCEDAELEEWRQSHDTRNCPQCHTIIEKEIGCNIMTCTKCNHHFCWICLEPRGNGKHSCPLN